MSEWKAADEDANSVVGEHGQYHRVAKDGFVFVCRACGKQSKDNFGYQSISRGWDESCMLNAVLCEAKP